MLFCFFSNHVPNASFILFCHSLYMSGYGGLASLGLQTNRVVVELGSALQQKFSSFEEAQFGLIRALCSLGLELGSACLFGKTS